MLGYSADEQVARPLLIHDIDEIAERAAELGVARAGVFTRSGARRVRDARVDLRRKDGERLRVSLTITSSTTTTEGHRVRRGRLRHHRAGAARAALRPSATRRPRDRHGGRARDRARSGRPDRALQPGLRAAHRVRGGRRDRPPAWEALLPPEVAEPARRCADGRRPDDFPCRFEIDWMTADRRAAADRVGGDAAGGRRRRDHVRDRHRHRHHRTAPRRGAAADLHRPARRASSSTRRRASRSRTSRAATSSSAARGSGSRASAGSTGGPTASCSRPSRPRRACTATARWCGRARSSSGSARPATSRSR